MDIVLLLDRIKCAKQYIICLSEIRSDEDWLNTYKSYEHGNLCLPAALALAHPNHFIDAPHAAIIRGAMRFGERDSADWCGCQSKLIWGYECPLEDTSLEADHLFPYAAGGPTVSENRIWLCSYHNGTKSNDIHMYPWEQKEPNWVGNRLKVIASCIGSGFTSNEWSELR